MGTGFLVGGGIPLPAANFTNITVQAGVGSIQGSLSPPVPSSPLYYTGGVAVVDINDDGWLDLYVTRLAGGNQLFVNNRDGTFTDQAHLFGIQGPPNSSGAVFADLDNDGDPDLVLTAVDSPRYFLLINQGDGTFTEEAELRGAAVTDTTQPHNAFSVTVGDYDRDGWLDLHFNDHYLNQIGINPETHSVLLRNRGAQLPGYFENATQSAGVAIADLGNGRQFSFSSYFTDLDSDGWPDLAIASDINTSKLFWNNGDGTFTNGTAPAGVNRDENGMGGTLGDFDGDGDLDWYVTSIHDNPGIAQPEGKTGSRLYRNEGNRRFSEVSESLGLRDGGWGWGTQFFDSDNDGDLDLVATNGIPANLLPLRDLEQTRFWINQGNGTFSGNVATDHGIVDQAEGTGLVTLDFDNDGDLDLFIANNLGTPVLYRNEATSGHAWLRLRLEGTLSNRDGIGARIKVQPGADQSVQTFEYNPSNLYLAAGEPIVHIGLGTFSGPLASLTITWPSGVIQSLTNVSTNQVFTVVEPGGRQLSPPAFVTLSSGGVFPKHQDITLLATATGSPPPAYNWFKDGIRIERATGPSHTLKHAHPFDSGIYTVVASNPQGSTASADIPVLVDWDLTPYSIARVWNEAILDAIRVDIPRPTLHARNLFHLSVALWDSWVAYESNRHARPYLVDERRDPPRVGDPQAARQKAMSYAAYRVLAHRYRNANGAPRSLFSFNFIMDQLGYDPTITTTDGDSPAAVGNRIGAAVIAFGLADGSNEINGYADLSGYAAVNPPLSVTQSGTTLTDPNRWQPLHFDALVTQNGIPIGSNTQSFVGVNWGAVTPFALSRPLASDVYRDPGPPPRLGQETDALYKSEALEIVRFSSLLDPALPAMIDLSPAYHGRSSLGTNDGQGHPEDSSPSSLVKVADFGRVLAEFWADGPDSETPPGHWNTLANYVSDHPATSHQLYGQGPALDRLEWDVKLYLAMNGAMHDAAIAAWDAKAKYDFARPISMIRYLCAQGQSSDPTQLSYSPQGMSLEPGLVEIITPALTAAGQKFAHLAGHEGEIAILAWKGEPQNPLDRIGGTGWIRGVNWVPYQRASFVTPPFAAYISGHSTFSRAAAEILTLFTGDPDFPSHRGEFLAPKNDFLVFEEGPSTDVWLQWRSYYDAADEAGISRLYGGIHISADDFNGRIVGSRVGVGAFRRARSYFRDPGTLGNPIANLSTRGRSGAGDATLTAGFVLEGDADKTLLIRGVGPTLLNHGISDPTRDPSIGLFATGAASPFATNEDWSPHPHSIDLRETASVTGAFPLDESSKDAALIAHLPAGVYTFQIKGPDGIALAEIYDAAPGNLNQLVNLSTRGWVGQGENSLIAGFVVTGTEPVQILIRAVGPTLTDFGLEGVQQNPTLTLFRQSETGGSLVAINDDWMANSVASAIESLGLEIGTFPLHPHSADAALLLTLQPGVYTAIMSGATDSSEGIGLLEFYWVR